MKAEGTWAWWNQYGNIPMETCLRRSHQVDGVIVKAGFWNEFDAFKNEGIHLGVEAYVKPSTVAFDANLLVEGVRRGAEFIVINAEVEWDHTDGTAMSTLISMIRQHTQAEIYASVDTRGNRTHLSYQQVLGREATAWMPMIYPLAFYEHRPSGYVQQAFVDCLDRGQDFRGKPILPTLQTYGNIGAEAVQQEIDECKRREMSHGQAYTICHARLEEWQKIAGVFQGPDDEMQEALEMHEAILQVSGSATLWAGYAQRQELLPDDLKTELLWLLQQPNP